MMFRGNSESLLDKPVNVVFINDIADSICKDKLSIIIVIAN